MLASISILYSISVHLRSGLKRLEHESLRAPVRTAPSKAVRLADGRSQNQPFARDGSSTRGELKSSVRTALLVMEELTFTRLARAVRGRAWERGAARGRVTQPTKVVARHFTACIVGYPEVTTCYRET